MHPYLGPTVHIKEMDIVVAASTFIPQHITEMESIAHLWRDGWIAIWNAQNGNSLVGTQDFPLILNSPTILQCQLLIMNNPHFSFKDSKVLYSVDVIDINYGYEDVDLNYWQEFLEQSGRKLIVVMSEFPREKIDNLLDRLSKAFSSAVLPNAFKLVFVHFEQPLIEYCETNKKGIPTESEASFPLQLDYCFTLERSTVL
ncbi:hypothetical protein DdX_18748 [Ditylenchus destructor]|uniref:Uncharacterized protein n=1 Tax=Ditylenchus destructor TaxID=166010 RepID=A0AAD4QXV3_9BILA|nr:hypothetical protein DdX_18748 [Ditylenchus destructor]